MAPMSDVALALRLQAEISDDRPNLTIIQGSFGHHRRRGTGSERWRRCRDLGAGGFGHVYLDECIEGSPAGRVRAVKKLPNTGREDYYQELNALALFSLEKYRENFVRCLGWYTTPQNIFPAMEYFPHGDLQRYLDHALPEGQCQTIICQILEALDFMHERRFTHRYLKPGNILVAAPGPKWWVKLADFGITKRTEEGVTSLRSAKGTRDFCAPEILLSDNNSSYTSTIDIRSVGIITFLTLTGTGNMNYRSLFRYSVRVEHILPDTPLTAQGVSQAVKDFVTMLLARDARLRPSASESLQATWIQMAATFDHLQSLSLEDDTPDVSSPSSSSGDVDFSWQPSARWTSDELFPPNFEELPTVSPATAIRFRGPERTFTGQSPAEGGRTKDLASPFVYGTVRLDHQKRHARDLNAKQGDILKVFHFSVRGDCVLASFLSWPNEWGYIPESCIDVRLALGGPAVTIYDATRYRNVPRTALPDGYEVRLDPNLDRVYYVDIDNQRTTLEHSKLLAAKESLPSRWAGDELMPNGDLRYTDHNNKTSTLKPPSTIHQLLASGKRSGRIRPSDSMDSLDTAWSRRTTTSNPPSASAQRSDGTRSPNSMNSTKNISKSHRTSAFGSRSALAQRSDRTRLSNAMDSTKNIALSHKTTTSNPPRPYDSPKGKLIRLTIKYDFLKSYHVSVHDSLDVNWLLYKVERDHPGGIPPGHCLTFKGKDLLAGRESLKDMGMKNGSTLHVKQWLFL